MYTGPHIVTDGLVQAIDAASARSYPGSGTAWNDLSVKGNNTTLENGPVYSSDKQGVLKWMELTIMLMRLQVKVFTI